MDRYVVRARLERMLHELDEIERSLPITLAEYVAAEAESRRYELEHRMYIALQAMIDTAAHVAVVGGARRLDTYGDAIVAMAELGIADRTVVDRLAGVSGLRNALAHTYLEVDDARVYRAMKDADAMRLLAAAIWRWVEEQ